MSNVSSTPSKSQAPVLIPQPTSMHSITDSDADDDVIKAQERSSMLPQGRTTPSDTHAPTVGPNLVIATTTAKST